MSYQYITLRENPAIIHTAAEWFHDKWRVSTEAYLACMSDYLYGKNELGWYLCLKGEKIIGGLGVIENDFHDRSDLTPNICAVYTEKAYRKQGVAGRLLNMAVEDLRKKGISPVYLLTDHTGFYERYGWEFFCLAQGDGEETPSRMYIHRKSGQRIACNLCARSKLLAYRSFSYIQIMQNGEVDSSNFL